MGRSTNRSVFIAYRQASWSSCIITIMHLIQTQYMRCLYTITRKRCYTAWDKRWHTPTQIQYHHDYTAIYKGQPHTTNTTQMSSYTNNQPQSTGPTPADTVLWPVATLHLEIVVLHNELSLHSRYASIQSPRCLATNLQSTVVYILNSF